MVFVNMSFWTIKLYNLFFWICKFY